MPKGQILTTFHWTEGISGPEVSSTQQNRAQANSTSKISNY